MSDEKYNFQLNRNCRPAVVKELVRENNVFIWIDKAKIWVEYADSQSKNIFSSVGIGVRGAEFIVRESSNISMFNAIGYNNKHYFITSIEQYGQKYKKVICADTDPVECKVEIIKMGEDKKQNRPIVESIETFVFPAHLVEKYVGYQDDKVTGVQEVTYIFVTPKQVQLSVGDVIESGGLSYHIEKVHHLDSYKNEYEAVTRGDV